MRVGIGVGRNTPHYRVEVVDQTFYVEGHLTNANSLQQTNQPWLWRVGRSGIDSLQSSVNDAMSPMREVVNNSKLVMINPVDNDYSRFVYL